MSKKVIVASADDERALGTAMYTLETAANVKYGSHAYMVGCYHSMLIRILNELPASHTIKFTETVNNHHTRFFSEEK